MTVILLLAVLIKAGYAQDNDSTTAEIKTPSVRITQIKDNDRWFAPDKLKHFMASAVIAGAGTYWAKHKQHQNQSDALTLGCSVAFTMGIAKEIADKRKGRVFSLKDGLADLLGIIAGVLIFSWW